VQGPEFKPQHHRTANPQTSKQNKPQQKHGSVQGKWWASVCVTPNQSSYNSCYEQATGDLPGEAGGWEFRGERSAPSSEVEEESQRRGKLGADAGAWTRPGDLGSLESSAHTSTSFLPHLFLILTVVPDINPPNHRFSFEKGRREWVRGE
jgi:hypothetical protein